MRKGIGFSLLLILLCFSSAAEDTKVEFDPQAAWTYIKELCTDAMEGRKSGQSGGVKGEEYIAGRFREWGLEPAGDNGTYFQNFTIEHRNVGAGVAFEAVTRTGRRDFYYNEDWRVGRYSGSGHFDADIIYVGMGIHAPDSGYDDYAGVDVKGKVVLMADPPSDIQIKKFGEAAEADGRIEAAQKHGALGAIVFSVSTAQPSGYYGPRISKELYKPDFVILAAERQFVEFLFKNHSTDVRQLTRSVLSRNEPDSFDTGSRARVEVDSIYDPERKTRNVLAKITGDDPKLKNEFVVIGAHMDHLGLSPLGDVYYGANDNASGTAVVMEIARIMKLNGTNPKRTVIFAAWAGEEQGLLGSYYYADNTVHPIEKTVVYINMDMVGHGSGITSYSGEYFGPHIWDILEAELPKEILETTSPSRGGPGGSDHTPFLNKGVPAFGINVPGAVKYHQPYDHPDLIKPEMLKTVGDLVFASVKILANEEQNLILPRRQETYNLKQQNLINFKLANVDKILEHRKDTKDSHVDLQLAFLEEKEGFEGDGLRLDLVQKLFDLPGKFRNAPGLSPFTSMNSISLNSRQGRTTVLAGLRGVKALRDNPAWGKILAEQGLYFVFLDDVSFLFGKEGLSEEGKKSIEALSDSGLLFFIRSADDVQSKVLLSEMKKPFVLASENIPGKEILDLVKEKDSAFGLVLSAAAGPAEYADKIDALKEAIGTQHVIIVSDPCLWQDQGKSLMLEVIAELIKKKYGSSDLSAIFSGTFLRVLSRARGEDQN